MGDFLVDFRSRKSRDIAGAARFLRFFDDMHVETIDREEFGLVLTSPDEPRLWASAWSADHSVFAGLCGRLALEQTEWDEALREEGEGGLACKYILKRYRERGIEITGELSGHYVVLIFDRLAGKFFVATDRWGIAPAFLYDGENQPVISSHPDALADATGERLNLDMTSLAEFVLTCKLSHPYTYYQRIRALPVASMTTLAWDGDRWGLESTRPHFEFQFDPHSEQSPDAFAEELEAGFRNSLRKRTLAILGQSAIALSGGLDSRALLCAAPRPEGLVSFCCYDEMNEEFRIARKVAQSIGAEFVPLPRDYDFYADSALAGVKISAGMGCIASNHFLGIRKNLQDMGATNLLTGCYCDYVFKGLALNKKVNPWSQKESIGRFDFSYYAKHFESTTSLAAKVSRRLEEGIPVALREYDTENRIAEVERRRIYPLSYEEDNAMRMIPQRVMGWYVPVAENDLLSLQLKMTSEMKLNRNAFVRMVSRICGPSITAIRDANTGQPVFASRLRLASGLHLRRMQGWLGKLRNCHAGAGSWPNWSTYAMHSAKIGELWEEPSSGSHDIFTEILGKERYHRNHRVLASHSISIFLRLFTIKLWLQSRTQ